MVRNEREMRRKENSRHKTSNDCCDKMPHFQRNEEGSVKTLKEFNGHQALSKQK